MVIWALRLWFYEFFSRKSWRDKNDHLALHAHFSYNELEEERKFASLLFYQVDGLILTESHHTQRSLQKVKNAGVLVVETMELPELPIDMALTRSKGFKHIGWSITAIGGALQFK